jgi:hypothetical protein
LYCENGLGRQAVTSVTWHFIADEGQEGKDEGDHKFQPRKMETAISINQEGLIVMLNDDHEERIAMKSVGQEKIVTAEGAQDPGQEEIMSAVILRNIALRCRGQGGSS